MLEITLENYQIIRVEAEDLDLQVDTDGDLRVLVADTLVAYYPKGQWRWFINMTANASKTTTGTRTESVQTNFKFIK